MGAAPGKDQPLPSDEYEMTGFGGWLAGASMGVIFNGAKVTALLAQCAQPELTELLKNELREHGEGYLMAALSLADVKHAEFRECANVLQRTLTDSPAVVLSEFSGQQIDDVTAGLFRKLKPLTSPVRETYVDALDKLRHPGVRDFFTGLLGPYATVSWMVFDFPVSLLRPEVLAVVEQAWEAGWPIDPAWPIYDVSDLMDDIRDIALTLSDDAGKELSFIKSIAGAQGPVDLARIVMGWRLFSSQVRNARMVLALGAS